MQMLGHSRSCPSTGPEKSKDDIEVPLGDMLAGACCFMSGRRNVREPKQLKSLRAGAVCDIEAVVTHSSEISEHLPTGVKTAGRRLRPTD